MHKNNLKKISCKNAYYIKLGRKGKWEASSIQNNIMRIGWPSQKLSDINSGNWNKIRRELGNEISSKSAATRDYNALRRICDSTNDEIWITFHGNYLWWSRVTDKTVYEDEKSKYRKVDKWRNVDIFGNPLIINNISGRISKIQGFRGTVCKVKEVKELVRLINSEESPEYISIFESRKRLYCDVEKAIKLLHWKDFETLVDLVFRATGWRRVSVLGEMMKFSDIELEDPINNEFYQVQVKSFSSYDQYFKYLKGFDRGKYRKLFYVAHSTDSKLSKINTKPDNDVQLILVNNLAGLVVDLGLTNWLMHKIK